jgi:RimJ/RimL family protein N-acetyltransferase
MAEADISHSVNIRKASQDDIKAYTRLLQRVYEDAYADEGIGLGREYFSMKLFLTEDTQEYLRSNLAQSKEQLALLAFYRRRLVGSITIKDMRGRFKLSGFYVDTKMQGKGIGKRLLGLALGFARGKEIYLTTYAHNKRSIELYSRWGFKRYGWQWRLRWKVWPRGVYARMINMRLPSGSYAYLVRNE